MFGTGNKLRPYYGSKKLPRNRRFASMLEAVQANRVRRFGLFKVDKQLVDYVNKKSDDDKNKMKLQKKLNSFKAGITGLIKRIKESKTEETKEKLKKEARKQIKQMKIIEKKIANVNKKKAKLPFKANKIPHGLKPFLKQIKKDREREIKKDKKMDKKYKRIVKRFRKK